MQVWRLLDTGSNNGFYNMAVDEAIAIASKEERVKTTTLRFYRWSPPCMSIGYFQTPPKGLSEGKDVAVVRRITGGRAVFHGNDLSYSIVSKTDNPLFPSNIKGTYHAIAEALISGLKHLGITPDPLRIPHSALRTPHSTLNPPHSALRTQHYHHSTLCFDTALGHEVCVNGEKIIGSAQRRWKDMFLQHGSMFLAEGDHVAIISSLCAGFRATFWIKLVNEELTHYEKELTERLIEEKYSMRLLQKYKNVVIPAWF
ncbi:MAG: hypothetical protein HZA12_00260 [Nitrospirae bacterium]|nr:hypothetical protein [Nitrospirota bacterium]